MSEDLSFIGLTSVFLVRGGEGGWVGALRTYLPGVRLQEGEIGSVQPSGQQKDQAKYKHGVLLITEKE